MTKLTTALVLGAALLAHGAPTTLAAQTHEKKSRPPEPSPDALQWVVDAVLANNRRLAQERLLVERAEAEVAETRGRFLPSLSLDGRYTEQSGTVNLGDFVNPAYAALNEITGQSRFPTDLDITLPLRHQSSVRLVQPIFDAAILAGHGAARHRLEAQRAQRAATSRALAAEAQTALLEAAAARSLREILESTVPLVEEAERVSQRLVDAGTATPDAVFRTRADRSEVEQSLAEAREREAAATRALNQLLGRPLDAPIALPAESDLPLTLDVTEEEAVAGALAGREELLGLESAVEASRQAVRLATAAFLPTASVAVDYGFQGRALSFDGDSDFWTASVVVSWNLFNGGQDAARRHAARADVNRNGLALDEAVEQVRLDATQAWQATRVARDAIATAEARSASARRTFDLVRRRYEEGLATPVDFLDARTNWTSAELNRAVTVYRFAIRRVDLERAAALRTFDHLETPS